VWEEFDNSSITGTKKPPGIPAAGGAWGHETRTSDSDNLFTPVTAMAIFTPFFASFGCALRVILEVTPALLATFTSCC